MAYAALPSKVASDTLDLADYNKIKGNFEASAPDGFTTKGDLFVATGPDAGIRLGVGVDDAVLVADSGAASGLVWQIVPRARVYNDADLNPSVSSWWTVTFNQERYDPLACHSTVSNTSRLTVPTGGAGQYHIGGALTLDVSGESGDGTLGLRVWLNATDIIAENYGLRGTNVVDQQINVSCDYELTVTDYVELQVFTSKDVNVLNRANISPEFWWHWVGMPA